MTGSKKELKKTDYVIMTVIVLFLSAFFLFWSGFAGKFSKTPVKAEKDINFTVFLRGVTLTSDKIPFKTGEETFITIRNVPYTKLVIKDVKFDSRKIVVGTANSTKTVEDPATPNLYDYSVTVSDKAKITDDGAVIGGNKIKIGIPIILEGETYKLQGVVSDVEFAKD